MDGRGVVLDYSQQEKEVADIIATKYGKDVQMVPRVNVPQGISTPDYLIGGERYDLKTVKESGKSTLYNAVSKHKEQFILDLSQNALSDLEIKEQIRTIFYSTHTKYVKEMIIFKNGNIENVYKRK